ncbi:MAG: transposase [Haliscomenobacter sp.]|nr:transposase [Haliscomenobacter sp.]
MSYSSPARLHFVTLTIVGWIDLFTRKVWDCCWKASSFAGNTKDSHVYAYVVMSNHAHLIVRADAPGSLSAILRDLKKFTAVKFLEAIQQEDESRKEWLLYLFAYFARKHARNSKYQVWAHSNAPIELRSPDFVNQKLQYIHFNPVKAGWVQQPEAYLYSSASNYVLGEGVFEVTLLEPALREGWARRL